MRYGEANDFARVATGPISVTAPRLGDGDCTYELPVADGATYDMMVSLAGPSYVQPVSDMKVGTYAHPSPSYSPNYTLADDGSISTSAPAPTFSVANCVARWNRNGYGVIFEDGGADPIYVDTPDPGVCYYERATSGGLYVSFTAIGDRSAPQIAQEVAGTNWISPTPSTTYAPNYTVTGTRITG